MKIALIMLAAGDSRRFGENKLLYELDKKPMYLYTLEKLVLVAQSITSARPVGKSLGKEDPVREQAGGIFPGAASKSDAAVTVVTQYEEIADAARRAGALVLRNPHPEEGISSSLKIGLQANLDADACLFTVSDQPWLAEATIAALVRRLEASQKGIACVSCKGKPGNPCIFTRKYYPALLSLTGDTGGKAVIKANPEDTAFLLIEDARELQDIDRMAELP